MRFYFALFFLVLIGCSSGERERNKVLLVSFDGFRYDYLTKTNTPNFDTLVKNGVISEGLIPIYPSDTFPNYYAIATGLYPENNGFISNSMYDSTIGTWFSMGDREQVENAAWYGGEPIWNTAEKQNVRAGTMFWVGSEAPIQDMRPTHWKPYNGDMPNTDRIDSVLTWLTLETENEIDLGTLYFSFVDGAGHRFGPNSAQVIQAIQQADSLVGYMMDQIREKELENKLNIILVSDHGMSQLSRDRIIYIDEFLELDDLDIYSWGPSFSIRGNKQTVEGVFQKLKANEQNFVVYKKEDVPDRLNIKNSPRFPDLVAIADAGYMISTRSYADSRESYATGGTHGYDNLEQEMHGLLVLQGPNFKNGVTIPSVENIHIYELIAHILKIKSAGTNGSVNVFKSVLR